MNDFGSIALVILTVAALNVAFGDLIEDVLDRTFDHIRWWSEDLAFLAGYAAATIYWKLKWGRKITSKKTGVTVRSHDESTLD